MKIIKRLTLLLLVVLIAGCLRFGKDEETTSPTKIQIDKCKTVMYLNPSINISPVGYKIIGSGIDDAIWFIFKTDTAEIQDIFDSKVVDTSEFKEGFTFNYDNIWKMKWWKTEGKRFLGGQVELPNVKYMNVGIEDVDDDFVVYIMWHEV